MEGRGEGTAGDGAGEVIGRRPLRAARGPCGYSEFLHAHEENCLKRKKSLVAGVRSELMQHADSKELQDLLDFPTPN